MPTVLTQISSTSWEHPADRAALNALRALPGFDEAVREIFGYFGERGIRQLFLGNAVRVGPAQRPRLWASYQEVLRTLDWPGTPEGAVPELYVTQTPFVNAGAVGFKEPFIVLNTASLELLDEAERRFLLAHEVGHVMSGHVTYRTLAVLLLTVGLGALPIVVSAVLLPMQLALLEWYRKAELSSDRAGLLGVQEPRVAASTFLKLAGGTRPGMGGDDDPLDVDAFLAQAEEYTSAGGARDTVLRVLNTALRDHPFNTVRAGELQRWVRDGGYGVILAGEYDRRGERRRPLGDDVREAADYYGDQVRDMTSTLRASLGRAMDAFGEAFRESGGGSGSSGRN
ncbi:MAG TPA: M48 family metallopeptidase [Gemmatirosa sp.]|nr:M48 family metallopeptidase [Gemmatirosa sp.]